MSLLARAGAACLATALLALATTARAQEQSGFNFPLSNHVMSGIIAVGGTFQLAADTDRIRRSIDFVNISAHSCYLFIGTVLPSVPAIASSIAVAPGQEYLRITGPIPNDQIWVTCDSTSDPYYLAVQ
jgi:hypothetical protein